MLVQTSLLFRQEGLHHANLTLSEKNVTLTRTRACRRVSLPQLRHYRRKGLLFLFYIELKTDRLSFFSMGIDSLKKKEMSWLIPSVFMFSFRPVFLSRLPVKSVNDRDRPEQIKAVMARVLNENVNENINENVNERIGRREQDDECQEEKCQERQQVVSETHLFSFESNSPASFVAWFRFIDPLLSWPLKSNRNIKSGRK